MRRARITYQGAYHHVMNRGYDGNPIFSEKSDKENFLNLMKLYSEKLKIRIFAYCLMNNHYHMILENSSGRMSDFLKQLNGNYGSMYRKKHGGKGYVFQDRYKSMLIQDDSYLLLSISYVLNNPVKAKINKSFLDYEWSSGSFYFDTKNNDLKIVDTSFVEDLFGNKKAFINTVIGFGSKLLPVIGTKVGKIVGGEEFISKAMSNFDRRGGRESMERKRVDDKYFDSIGKIIMEFEKMNKIRLKNVEVRTLKGKRLRNRLLFYLKEKGGLKYREIIKMDLFSDLKLSSLGQLYKREKERFRKEQK